MVIIRLSHGLGNQMFQYAFGKRIEQETKLHVKYDVSYYLEAKNRGYPSFQLSKFHCNLEYAKYAEVNHFFHKNVIQRIADKIRRTILPYYKQHLIIEEKPYQFDENIYNTRDKSYYAGFWQNEKYFESIKELLRKEFNINQNLYSNNLDILELINNNYNRAVCLHIRRGDYVGNNMFDLNGIEYYTKAIDIIRNSVDNAMFFVFSDDSNWVKLNLHIDNMFIVDVNSKDNSFMDFQLMRNCRHFIISNSTFSWWAAWLNARPDQIKIAPLKWINHPRIKKVGIVPSDWISI